MRVAACAQSRALAVRRLGARLPVHAAQSALFDRQVACPSNAPGSTDQTHAVMLSLRA